MVYCDGVMFLKHLHQNDLAQEFTNLESFTKYIMGDIVSCG